MNAQKIRTLAAAIAIPLVPSAALAQGDAFTLEAAPITEPEIIYVNEIELGVGYTNIDSYKFGEYTGLNEDGAFPIANIHLLSRPAWDSGDTPRYWELDGTNLGIESRSVRGEYGVQGNYELFIEYDQIPHYQFNDGKTPYVGAGGTTLTLPAGWTPNNTPATMVDLLPSLRGLEVETERKNLGAGLLKHLSLRWKIGVDFHHDTKEGIDVIGAAFAGYGGNPKAMILPEPIDYETNRVNFFAEYVDKKSMFRFAYELSAFSNDESSLTFQNPYLAQPGGPPNSAWLFGYPDFGRLALPPDNLAHSFSLSGARTLGVTSRLSASLTHTRYEQDETFLPYTVNPSLVVTTPLPRNSLDGVISTTIFDLGYTSRPIKKLDLAARYRFAYRDNDTPMDTFINVPNDVQNQSAGTARINLPYGSGTENKVTLEGGYRLIPSTKLSLGYEFEQIERDYSEVEKTRENTVSAKISSSPFETASGWIRYAYSDRTGSAYRSNLLYVESHPGVAPTAFENLPELRKYNIADRNRNEVRGVLNYMPHPRFSINFDGSLRLDDYDETQIGLTEQRMSSVTLDFAVNPRDDITANAFVTYENLQGDDNGCQWNPGGPCETNPPAPDDSWRAETEDRVITFGVGADWQINSRLGVGTDISFSRAVTEIDVTGGANLTTAPLPDIDSKWYSLGVHLNYKLKKNLEARLSYAYEYLKTDDWAVDGVDVDTLNDVITLGEASPNYNGNVIGLALSYKY